MYVFCSEFLVGVDKSDDEQELYDINYDAEVDMFDYFLIKNICFNRSITFDDYPKADCNDDGIVDMFDYLLVKAYYFQQQT